MKAVWVMHWPGHISTSAHRRQQ